MAAGFLRPWAVAGLRGAPRSRPPWGSKFFQFHAVFGKIWQNRMLAPPSGELAPLSRGNPGSATDGVCECHNIIRTNVLYPSPEKTRNVKFIDSKRFSVQSLFVPFACVGSGDPVRVLRLYTTNTLDILWSIYCWDICTTCRYQC